MLQGVGSTSHVTPAATRIGAMASAIASKPFSDLNSFHANRKAIATYFAKGSPLYIALSSDSVFNFTKLLPGQDFANIDQVQVLLERVAATM